MLDIVNYVLMLVAMFLSQGKGAKAVMARLAPGLNVAKMNFMTGAVATVAGTYKQHYDK